MAEMQAAVVFDMSAAVEAVAAEAAGDLTLAFDASGDAHNSAADASAVLEARRPQVLVPRRNRSNYLAALAELDEDLALVAQRRRVAA
jgi:dihydropteroate synthase